MALIISRKSPKVTMVIGRVNNTKIGLTMSLNKAITIATIIAEPYPSTATPGKIFDNTTTARAVSNNLMISFKFVRFKLNLKIKKTAHTRRFFYKANI